MRLLFEDLDVELEKVEEWIEDNGIPFCDYKLHRNKYNQLSANEKFRMGVRRICKILKSQQKGVKLTEMLEQMQEKAKEETKAKERKKYFKEHPEEKKKLKENQESEKAILLDLTSKC